MNECINADDVNGKGERNDALLRFCFTLETWKEASAPQREKTFSF